jgi:CO/xanthine dehydrogenase Mo-binding subunit
MENPNFLKDFFPKNLLYAVTIRSPVPSGTIKLIQIPKLPNNYTLITARDIPGENRLEDTDIPILADGNLSYSGEPAALLIGPDKTKLEELALLCEIIFEESKPVFTCEEDSKTPAAVRELQIGDTQGAFIKTGKIVANSYSTGVQDHWYAEPVGAVTLYRNDDEGKKNQKNKETDNVLVVKTATQWPYHVKRSVARALGIDPAAVCVEPSSLNIHMDGKLWYPSLVASHAAIGTFLTKKPVRLILNREEDFLFTPKRCNTNIDIVSSIDEKGNITAAEIDISVNMGAYAVNSQEILDQICLGSIGYYSINNLKLSAKANKTNIPPQGAFSGFGLAQGFFAMERHVSQIADMVNQDPALWRKNRVDSRMILPSGLSLKNHVSGDELIESAAKMSDYYRKWASYELLRQSRRGKSIDRKEYPRGIGIALGFQGDGLLYHGRDNGAYGVEVTLSKEGILEIKTSITSSDEDFGRIWGHVASEILSIDPELVRLKNTQAPDCGPSCASRNITAITKMVEKCCHVIRKKRFHDPLPITVRRLSKPKHGFLWDGRFLPHEGKNIDISGFSKLGMAAAVVEVAIDPVECVPKIRGVWLGIDGGKIISPNRAKRCISRSAVQALGWSFTENIEYSAGVLPKYHFNNFAIPSPAYIPPIYVDFISGSCADAKGIGELPFTCIPAAFLQAVSQAMDFCFKSVPLKRKEIWEMVRFRNTEHSQAQK